MVRDVLSVDLGNARAQYGCERQNSDKSPGSTLPIKRSSKSRANSKKQRACGLRERSERANMANQRDFALQKRVREQRIGSNLFSFRND
jgi:hypothetical protein